MKIGIVGVGFVGGATAEVFKKVHDLYLYDRYKEKYSSKINIETLVQNSEVAFVCVPTPMKPSGEMDYSTIYYSLDLLKETAREINRNPKDLLVTIRSTAVSGTTDELAVKYDFKIVFNPEFLREKHAVEDMLNTNRIIIGANEEESAQKLISVYKPLFPNAKYIVVDRKTAEMIKYVANVILTGQVAIANEIYQICKVIGVNYDIVKNTILLDERIGRNLNVPGPDGDLGFGGKCFPKDLNALIYLAREYGYRPHLLEEIWDLNLKVRKDKDWLNIPGAVSENKDFKTK